MPREYPPDAPKLKATVISDEALLNIGRLVRACAEIEDIVDCFIATLAEISETKALILLGRTAIKRKLEIAEQLAKIRTDRAHEVAKAAFNSAYYDILDCRNAVAHGTLIGEDDLGCYAFLTAPSGTIDGDAVTRIVINYHPDTIRDLAKSAEALVPMLVKYLQVEELRAERLQRPLKPHAKARVQARAKPQRPPPPSRE